MSMGDPLWARFLNSDWHDYRGTGAREDRLFNDAWLKAFLAATCWGEGALPGAAGREALRELRGTMRAAVETFRTGQGIAPEHLRTFNRLLADAPVVRAMDASGALVLVQPAGDLRHVLSELVAAFAAMVARGEPARLKICANPDCGWVIYDESRNLSRRWCDAADCGNLLKVRLHRQRRRGGGPPTSGRAAP